ncbi:molybdopterin molybdotransferase MoeA [Alteromonas sp. a30]|uniref:molybdopterin molybdotransferase MoeA n=1 Tax=Alteromonas sp. a30 TaxID=2730917 RepID=UPI0022822312|nr:gephyrin-like molybdotransferase Glp [Alteromonas sp. a30]MCY7296400.1 molybdopterin molybdotransferase MoeA [Alteromonas sp. a30]
MTSCNVPGLLPVEQAIQTQLNAINPITAHENIALDNALNRVLAVDITSPMNVPPINNSSMDGYALAFADVDGKTDSLTLTCVGESLAGHPFNGIVDKGQCVRIMTGAVIPEGTDTVVMQENTQKHPNDNSIIFNVPPSREGQSVRHIGEDIKQGQTVLTQGTRLTAAHLSMLASIGVAHVDVFRKLKVAVLVTGDELTPPGEPLKAGAIYESNRVGLVSMLHKLNIDVLDLGIIPDTLNAIKQAFTRAVQECDWIISSGGVSVGDADYVKVVLDELGSIGFWKVAIKPGKPYAFGKLSVTNSKNSFFSGLPGNPVSSFVTFHQLVVPALRKLSGEVYTPPPLLQAKSVTPFKKQAGRADYQRGRYCVDETGKLCVEGPSKQASNMMMSFFNANCYVVLEQERASVDIGETVRILPFDPILQ